MLAQGTSSSSTITVTSISGFTGTVALSLNQQGQTISASVSPSSVNVPANGVAHSTLSVTAPNTLGNYSITVTGLANSKSRTVYSVTMLTVDVISSVDFTITALPSTISNLMGTTNTTAITVTSLNGYAGNVSLSVTAPFGFITVTGSQNPVRVVAGGAASSALTIMTSTSTTVGTYSIVVTGTEGARTHSATISVKVVDPTAPPVIVENLKLVSRTFNNGTMLTMMLQNTGNGSLTLQSYVIQDSSGDAWSMTNWAGPTIAVGGSSSAAILIGTSCPTCIYTGITFLFTQFQAGHTYTVTVTTTRNNQFTFSVTD